jgi:hypothetical protein
MNFEFLAIGTINHSIFTYVDSLGNTVGIRINPTYCSPYDPLQKVLIKGVVYLKYIPFIKVESCIPLNQPDCFYITIFSELITYRSPALTSIKLSDKFKKYKMHRVIYDNYPFNMLVEDLDLICSKPSNLFALCYYNNQFVLMD